MNRQRELVKNTLILSIGTFLPKFTVLLTIPIITSNLTKVEYGTYDFVLTLVSLLLPIVTFQIHSAAFRFLIDCRDNPQEKKSVISNIYAFILPVAIITLIILYFFLSDVEPITRLLIATYFFVDILSVATKQVVRGLSNNKLFSVGSALQSFCNLILVFFTVRIIRLKLNGVLVSLIVATIIELGVFVLGANLIKEVNFKLFDLTVIKKMLNYSWPMIPNTLSMWVLSVSDRFVLKGFIGLEAVAVYAAANKIPQIFTSVQSTFIFAWQENASLAISDEDVEKYYSDIFDKIFCILAGTMAMLIGATPILFWLLIKGDYADAYSQMPILFMGMLFSALSSFLGGIYVAHKRTKNVGITTMIAACCNLLVDFMLVRSIGVYAASISTLVSYFLLTIYRMKDVKNFQSISYKYVKIILCLLVLVAMCVLCCVNAFIINVINMSFGCIFALLLNRKIVIGIIHTLKHRIEKLW